MAEPKAAGTPDPAELGAHTDDLLAFLAAAPSPYHAVEEAARRLDDAGFTPLDREDPWPAGPGSFYVRRGGSVVAWAVGPGTRAAAPYRIAGAHTDSPNLRVKPRPETTTLGYRQLGVEVYGGALYNSWLDRDLGLSGRVTISTRAGIHTELVRTDDPIARIPQLAIHLDRGVNDGLKLNPQLHLVPIWSLSGGSHSDGDDLRSYLAGLIAMDGQIDPASITGWDLMFHDVAPPARTGRHGELVSSGRIDNLLSCHAGLLALIDAAGRGGETDATRPGPVQVLTLFDHEEIGSQTPTGAQGAWLGQVLERICLARGGTRADFLQALAASTCVSADGAHATNPNYLDRHDPAHQITLDGGPVIKTNANQRYATEATTGPWLRAVADGSGLPHQEFVSRADMPCGSTIGPLTAAGLAIDTVDVGAPMLSMHAARELTSAVDAWRLTALLRAAYLAP
ncbi:MAG TPA: M18 family aminopeptidase [Acidimicrobiales bacterium]|nr:M18 family aminopeptidase [Acidimicrobiales bacterium]